MVVCQFYLRGQCKFGDSCRNEHPPQTGGGFGTTSWARPSTAATSKTDLPYNSANIAQDLNPKGEKPIWPLSSYAPFKSETTLIGGLDVSPEELRVKAAAAVNAGNVNEYIQYEANQIAAAEQVFTAARTNTSQTFEQAAKQSRLVSKATTSTSAFPSTSSAFNTAGSSSTFGNPTATPSSSAFSAPGNPATSAFGKPAFGQSAFGQPAPAFGQTGFVGQTSTITPTSAFEPTGGQSSGGQQAPTATVAASAFGQPSFGQPNPLAGADATSSVIKPASGAFSAFAGSGPSAFGAGAPPSLNSSGTGGGGGGGGFSAFSGQPTAFGQPRQTGSAFSALTSSNNNNTGSVFGSFGAPAPPTETTATSTTAQPVSVFGGGGGGGQSVFRNLNTNSSQQQPVSVFGQATSNLNVTPGGLMPTISMASSNSGGGSAFPASPMSAINPTAAASNKQALSSSKSIDFTALIARTTYRPGSTPYDSRLPQNYAAILPERANKAFRKERFTWAWQDGEAAVPEWVPPVDVR